MKTAVDIVVPIYNAYEDLLKCVESVYQYTDLTQHRLILIDDLSTDKRVYPYIQSQQGEHVIVLQNQKNLGFSAGVNRGMSLSSVNDVVILNTDTIVTADWLSKLQSCAYRSADIGTVTPLSNSATICSVPEFCEDNSLPEGYTVETFGTLVEKYSLKRYPDIPVAVGFCAYIKREVIEKTGAFDAESFKRGYGEENDFCFRATQLGYRHVLCDDTFIYHSGTASFVPEEKQKLIEEHNKILQTRYPGQTYQNMLFYTTDPIANIQENIKLHIALDNGKKRILFLCHRDFREDAEDHIGGTQLHLKDIVDKLKQNYNVFVMTRDGAFMRLTIYTDKKPISFRFRIDNPASFPVFYKEEFFKLYETIVDTFKIDLIHIQHIYQLSFDIFSVAHKHHVPLICTLHDYYYLCPTIKMIDCNGKCCSESKSTENCSKCLMQNKEISLYDNTEIGYIDNWRNNTRKCLALCDALITPSESAKDVYVNFFPELAERIHIIPHGIDMFSAIDDKLLSHSNKIVTSNIKYCWESQPKQDDLTLRGWAFMPGEDSEKTNIYIKIVYGEKVHYLATKRLKREDLASTFGRKQSYAGFEAIVPIQFLMQDIQYACVLEIDGKVYENETLNTLKKSVDYKHQGFTVAFVGGINEAKGSKIALNMMNKGGKNIHWACIGATSDRELKFNGRSNYFYTHWYQREELPSLLKMMQVDVICIMSIWPETFCYVLSEAIACRIPVIVTNVGAPAERVKKLGCGWIVSLENAADNAISIINGIIKDRSEYETIRNRLKTLKIRSASEMAIDYIKLYENLFTNESVYSAGDIHGILDNQLITANYVFGEQKYLQKLTMFEAELQSIKGGKAYKIGIALKNWNLPFKKQLFSFAYHMARLIGIKV